MNQINDAFNSKCGKCKIKPCAIICQECATFDRNENIAKFCYSCFNLSHDEIGVSHKKQSISYSNLKTSFSPRKVSLKSEEYFKGYQSKIQSSNYTSPYKKELFQSHVIKTPLNQNHHSNFYSNHHQNITDSIEKTIRESRKKEVITKLNELNNKLASNGSTQSQQSLFYSKYKENFSNIRSPLSSSRPLSTKDYVSNVFNASFKVSESLPTEKFEKYRTENNSVLKSTQRNQANSSIMVPEVKNYDSCNNKKFEEQKKVLKEQIEKIKKDLQEEDLTFNENELVQNQNLEEENRKFQLLKEEIQKNSEDYDAQVRALALNLKSIKGEYENKLQDFEKLLKNSTGTIEKLQQAIVEAKKKEQPKRQEKNAKNEEAAIEEMKKELTKKKEILEKFKQGVNLSTQKCSEVSQTLEKILVSKEKIAQELMKDNNQKDEDITKLHQIVDNFKQMFEELNVQKDSIVRDNERLAQELEKAREIILEALEKAKENGEYMEAAAQDENQEN